ADFPSYLAHVAPGGDPNVFDSGNGVPDYWDMALKERAISNPATRGHEAAMLTAYSANYAALQTEASTQAMQDAGHLAALLITGGGLAEASAYFQTYYGFSLTTGLYTEFAILDDNGDLDSDTVLNKDEQGTDAAGYVASATTPNPIGDIAWESQWEALAPLLAMAPDGTGIFECQIPDRWINALMEYAIATPGVVGHTPEMMPAFLANKSLLTAQNPTIAGLYGDLLALWITADRFDLADFVALVFSGTSLTDGGYTKFPALAPTGELDGDAILNKDEPGATLEQYLFNATEGVSLLVEGGDIAWEAQWDALSIELGFNLNETLVFGGPAPDRWMLSLMEYVTVTPGVAGHAASMVTAFSANKLALIQESPKTAAKYGDCVALLLMSDFDTANLISSVIGNASLTQGLYTVAPVLQPGGDLDADAVLNRNEGGATLPEFLGNATAGVQPLVEGGDIPWESQWEAMATALGIDPNGSFIYEYSVPDRWLFALMANVISTPGMAGHDASMVTAFNANKLALIQENPTCAALYADFTVVVLMSDIDDAQFISQIFGGVTLNPALYTEFPILRPSGDVDGDYIRNRNEGGGTLEEFLTNATGGIHVYVEGEDIPWEAQWQTFVDLVGPILGNTDPATLDMGNGVPDVWECALVEQVIMNHATVGHADEMVAAFNQNLLAIRSEVEQWADHLDVVAALAITSGAIDEVGTVSQGFTGVVLTDGLYTSLPILDRNGDLDGDGIPNEDEGGTDAATYIESATTPYSFVLAEGGDIPWESQWPIYVSIAGPLFNDMNPRTLDEGDGVPDYWQCALMERLIVDPSAPGHQAGMAPAFNANLATFKSEDPRGLASIGCLSTLTATSNAFLIAYILAQGHNGVPLTEGLYTGFNGAEASADPDGDGILNGQEYGYDATSYVSNALTGVTPVDSGGGTVSSYGGLDLIIPPSAFEESTPITILQTLLEEGTFVTTDDEEIEAVVPGGTFQVSGLENLRAGQIFTIVLEYPDANQDGLVDGTTIEETSLVILLRIAGTNEMVNLGGVVDTAANTVTATVSYDDLNAPPNGKQYESVRGISKDVGDETFVLAARPRASVPLGPWASVLLVTLIAVTGAALSRSQRPGSLVSRAK
ncbi:MAG: hypothetical protein WC655_26935, partial [Candidatus Hydrogenedentales bacterium]